MGQGCEQTPGGPLCSFVELQPGWQSLPAGLHSAGRLECCAEPSTGAARLELLLWFGMSGDADPYREL